MFDPTYLLIAVVGLLAGALNVLAGGGSLFVMPLLVELGFAGPVANGTTRLGILAQSAAAIVRFRRGGQALDPALLPILVAVLPGAALGALIGVQLEGAYFRYVLAGVMGLVWCFMAAGWFRKDTEVAVKDGPPSYKALTLLVAVGLYGGFLQAGVGFLLMAVLHRGLGFDLVRVNALKVWIVAAYTLIAIPIFAYNGALHLAAGLALAVGTSLGGWLGARLTLSRGETLIRVVFSLALLALIARLVFTALIAY